MRRRRKRTSKKRGSAEREDGEGGKGGQTASDLLRRALSLSLSALFLSLSPHSHSTAPSAPHERSDPVLLDIWVLHKHNGRLRPSPLHTCPHSFAQPTPPVCGGTNQAPAVRTLLITGSFSFLFNLCFCFLVLSQLNKTLVWFRRTSHDLRGF